MYNAMNKFAQMLASRQRLNTPEPMPGQPPMPGGGDPRLMELINIRRPQIAQQPQMPSMRSPLAQAMTMARGMRPTMPGQAMAGSPAQSGLMQRARQMLAARQNPRAPEVY